ncbi:MAG TPA: prolyl oligopeptidase family serine peptidase [Armatimonadota bacterium]|nr:prolyl oligopeptidase family serine peptidase [Armatimonadota bacterium]
MPCGRVNSDGKEDLVITGYEYYVHYPDGYHDNAAASWPLLITLHGAGERHVTLDALQHHHYYLPMYRLTATEYPCIVVVPHCPPREYWEPRRINTMLTEVLDTLQADPSRVYLSGFSMGGYGTWRTAGIYPERYAAIAPICGGGNPGDAKRLKGLPTWAFHGAKDEVVPVTETLDMVKAIEAVGGSVKVTIYPEGDHNVWDETYENPELYAWFLEHKNA